MANPEHYLIFEPAVIGLFSRQLGSKLTPEIREELRRVGINLEKTEAAYPVERFDDGLDILARRVFGSLPYDQAMREIGRVQVAGFVAMPAGWALFKFLRYLPRKQLIARIARSWKGVNNFMEMAITELTPSRYETTLSYAGRYPEVVGGVLEAALRESGQSVDVSLQRREGMAAVYLLEFAGDAAPRRPTLW